MHHLLNNVFIIPDLDICSIISILFVLDFIHPLIISVSINLKLGLGFFLSLQLTPASTTELYHKRCVQPYLSRNVSGIISPYQIRRITSSLMPSAHDGIYKIWTIKYNYRIVFSQSSKKNDFKKENAFLEIIIAGYGYCNYLFKIKTPDNEMNNRRYTIKHQ